MYNNILATVSFVETAEQMIEIASKLVDPNGTIHVLHVIQVPYHLPYSYADEEKQKARQLLQGVMICPREKPDVRMQYSIIAARSAAEVIVKKSKDWGCNVILMGASLRSLRESVVLGDVFNHVIRHACCEVISMSYIRGSKTRFRKILVPTSGYKHSERAAEVAKNLVERPGGKVTAMSVSEGEVGSEAVERIGAFFKGLDIEFTSVVKKGPIAQTILHEAETGNYDLLMIGATERSKRLKFILGSVADEIVKNAPVRVIVVRTLEYCDFPPPKRSL
jgi:nucleotide-binding universal stress UspA family protein